MEFNNVVSVINETSLSRIYSHTKNRPLAFISAERGKYTPAENNKHTEKLRQDLVKSGYGFVRARGGFVENADDPDTSKHHYKDTGEHSFMVVGHHDDKGELLSLAKELGSKYGQESIMHKPKDSTVASWHYTTGKDKGGTQEQGDFRQTDKAIYYTTVSGVKEKEKGNKTVPKVKRFTFD